MGLSARFASLLAAHARLKARIHATRFVIHSPTGRFAMGCFYVSAPLVAGWYTMQWTNRVARGNLGSDGELLLARAAEARRERERGAVRA